MKVPTVPLTTWFIPRESQEWIGPVVVTASGVVVTTWKCCILPDGTRPPTDPLSATWTNPTLSGASDLGKSVAGLAVGTYHFWVLYSTALEPGIVVEAGLVVAT